MISNKTRDLINLAINNLELNNPTQEDINKANNYLKEAIMQIKNENATTVEDLEKEFEYIRIIYLLECILMSMIFQKVKKQNGFRLLI